MMNNTINSTFEFIVYNGSNTLVDIRDYSLDYCTQINQYPIKIGIFLIITYILMCWGLWAFFKFVAPRHSYDKKDPVNRFIGDLKQKETQIYWDMWFRHRFQQACIIYIITIIYLFYNI